MKRFFEIFIVVFIVGLMIYSILYFFVFDKVCNKYVGVEEKNYIKAINKIAKCEDTLICYSDNLKNNEKKELSNWECKKKEAVIYKKQFYLDLLNHITNSVTK